MTEIPLSGGHSNLEVVRIGNTVRRRPTKATKTVHRLLKHLDHAQFHHAPKVIGFDDQGREVLSFIEGKCHDSDTAWRSDNVVISAARQLRSFHDHSRHLTNDKNAEWGFHYSDFERHEVICHNDYGLYNVVIQNDLCVGMIDFDLAGPGPRLRDIAYGAYWFTPLSQVAEDMRPFALRDVKLHSRRLKLFCTAYGITPNLDLLDMLGEVLYYMADKQAMIETIGIAQAQKLEDEGHLAFWLMEAEGFQAYRGTVEASLKL